jgi:hypothetical protein
MEQLACGTAQWQRSDRLGSATHKITHSRIPVTCCPGSCWAEPPINGGPKRMEPRERVLPRGSPFFDQAAASREIVACETLNVRATSACASPLPSRCRASLHWCGVRAVGRPNFTPLAFARALPSLVRARIKSRSNSAKPARIVTINRPCALVVSAQLSCSDLKPES